MRVSLAGNPADGMAVIGDRHPPTALQFEHAEFEFFGFSARESNGQRMISSGNERIGVAYGIRLGLFDGVRRCLCLHHEKRFPLIDQNGFRYTRSIAGLACRFERRSKPRIVPIFRLEILVTLRRLPQIPTPVTPEDRRAGVPSGVPIYVLRRSWMVFRLSLRWSYRGGRISFSLGWGMQP